MNQKSGLQKALSSLPIRLAWIMGMGAITLSVWADPVPVFVSILPQKYFVERVGGEHVKVSVMVKPGQGPETYEPSTKQLARLSNASVYFRIRAPFENVWMARLSAVNPDMLVIDCRQGIPLRPISPQHGGGVVGDGLEEDPHVWTSPAAATTIALNIRDGLILADPGNRANYQENYRRLADDLDRLDRDIRSILEATERTSFLVFHPSWGYFADSYGLEQIAIEVDGKEPGAHDLARVVEAARSQDTKMIFAQRQSSSRAARIVAQEIGAEVVWLDPLAENYLENMRHVARAIARSLRLP